MKIYPTWCHKSTIGINHSFGKTVYSTPNFCDTTVFDGNISSFRFIA